MSLTSVVINLKTNQKTVLDTAQVSVCAQNTLTLFRGQTFLPRLVLFVMTRACFYYA